MDREFEPQLVTVLREGYSRKQFTTDLSAGILVGIVALPLAIAFAVASNCTPQQGLFTAIIAGFIISAFSGSRVQIGGPTGAFIVLVASVVSKYGMDALMTVTVMAGALLLLFGIFKMGRVISFIPYPVTVGFTSAIAVIILTGQIPHALGLKIPATGPEFLEKIEAVAVHIATFNPFALVIALATFTVITVLKFKLPKLPGSLIALVLFSVITSLANLPVETLGDRFGAVSATLPSFSLPDFSLERMRELLPAAIAVALLGGIESLLSAVVADGMTGFRHRSNMELIAQGAANVVTPFFGGIPATGAIARTATNVKNGGRTPVAGMIHAVTLLLIVLFGSSLVQYIPFAVLAGILVVVAINMGEWHLFGSILKGSKSDAVVLLATFLLTLFVDLSVAIPAGFVIATIFFMKRMVDVTEMKWDSPKNDALLETMAHDGVQVFAIDGPFFFGMTSSFNQQITAIDRASSALILDVTRVPAIDTSAIQALSEVDRFCKKHGIALFYVGVQPQPLELLQRSTLYSSVESRLVSTRAEAYSLANIQNNHAVSSSMELQAYLNRNCVVIGVDCATKLELIDHAAAMIYQTISNKHELSEQQIRHALYGRDREITTGIGNRIALPHARLSSLSSLHIVLGTTARPIAFDSVDGEPIDLFACLLIPETQSTLGLKVMGQIMQLFMTCGEQIRACRTADELLRLISTVDGVGSTSKEC